MSGEIISVRILGVFRSAAERALLRQGAARASLPTEVSEADNAAAAEARLAEGGIDLVIMDDALPAAEKAGICAAARSAKENPFLICVGKKTEGVAVDGSVRRPTNAEEAKQVIDSCIRTRVPTRVLIVDDSSTMRGIVRKILSASKFPLKVAESQDGITALQELRGGGFDIVFLDYNMPGLDGFEILSELRRLRSRVAVVMMTSTENPSVAERARAAGAVAFFKKPFFPSDVDAVLYSLHKIDAPAGAG